MVFFENISTVLICITSYNFAIVNDNKLPVECDIILWIISECTGNWFSSLQYKTKFEEKKTEKRRKCLTTTTHIFSGRLEVLIFDLVGT